MMTKDTALEHTKALIKCPSITPLEGGALDYLEAVLSGAGFQCNRLLFTEEGTPDVDNLYARIGTSAPNLCFAGHTDVVPVGNEGDWRFPPFKAEIHDGILYGRGAADMKGGIACFLSAVLTYLEKKDGAFEGSISFLITGDEEGPAINGTVKMLQWLEEQGEALDHCIVGEPSNTAKIGDMIKNGRRGSLNGEIVIEGKQGHVAYQHLADNPIEGLTRVISKLLDEPLDGGTDAFIPSNLEFTNLEVGNEAVNVIPARASGRFNIRFNDAHTPSSLEALVRDKVAAALLDTPYRAQLSFNLSGDSFVTHSKPLTDRLARAIKDVTGLDAELSTSGGTSDARFIKNTCPVIEFGLVNKTIHQVDEHVPLEHFEQLTAIYENFLEDYFSSSS